LVLVTGALGIVLVVGLARLLLPPDGSEPGAVSATSSDAAVVASLAAPATTTAAGSDPSGRPSVTAVLTAADDRPGAVAIGVGNVLLTTAAAVDGRTELTVELAGGDVIAASVVTIDPDAGIAVLESDAELQPVTTAAAPNGGDEVTVLVGDGIQAVVSVDADGVLWLRPFVGDGPMEGTPVLNDDGDVVGLCSRSGSGRSRLVPVDVDIDTDVDPEASTTTSTVAPADERPWLGISATRTPDETLASTTTVDGTTATGVLIGGVMDDSPAAAAGLVAGDMVLTADGQEVRSIEALADLIAEHRPGDQLRLGLRRAAEPSTVVEVTVTLGHWPVAA
jgi:S1-C subfamily serine protease